MRKERLVVLEKTLSDLRRHVANYLDSMRAMAHASAEVGTDVKKAYAGLPLEGGATAETELASQVGTFGDGLAAIDGEARATADTVIVRDVLGPLESQLATIEGLRHDMRERELVKLDVDARTRKVAAMKEKGSAGGDPAELQRKEAKLANTQATLNDMTHRLYVHFDALDAQRHNVLGPAMRSFVNAQREFHSAGARLVGAIPPLPERLTIAPLGTVPMSSMAPAASTGATTVGTVGAAGGLPPLPQHGGMAGGSAGASSAGPSGPGASAAAPAAAAGGMAAAMAQPTAVGGGSGAASSSMPGSSGEAVRAVYAYKPLKPDELELRPGDLVTVARRNPDGWFVGSTADGRTGAFPGNYVAAVPPSAPST
jgi:hypothetical protein